MSTLDLLLSTAVVNGLRNLNITRLGSKPGEYQWQAATRWHGHDTPVVAIRETPEEAASDALSARPGANPAPVTTEAPHAYAAADAPDPDITALQRPKFFDRDERKPRLASLDEWDDPEDAPRRRPEPDDADDLDGW